MSAQQKSMKEAEQEKQWKQLQAMRAREQQMGLTNDQRMHHNMNGESIMKLYYFLHILNFFSPFRSKCAITNLNELKRRFNVARRQSLTQFT